MILKIGIADRRATVSEGTLILICKKCGALGGGFFKVVLLGHLLLPSAPYRVATPYVVAPEWYGDVYTLRELGLDVIIVVVLEWRFIIKVYAQPERRLEPAWRGHRL